MIQIANRKTWEGMREGAGNTWQKMTRFARPKKSGNRLVALVRERPWISAAVVLTSVLGGLAAFFYFRKKRQIADHYTMGESESAWDAPKYKRDEDLEAARRRDPLRTVS